MLEKEMLIEAKSILDLAVATIEDRKKVGIVKKIIIDRNNAQILGFVVGKDDFFLSTNFFLSEVDVLDIDINGLTIKSKEDLLNPSEVVRAKKIIDERFELLGLQAITKLKVKLGKVINFLIDTKTLQIVKFYISGWTEDKIIGYKQVYKITKQEIIFKDFIEKETVKEKMTRLATN